MDIMVFRPPGQEAAAEDVVEDEVDEGAAGVIDSGCCGHEVSKDVRGVNVRCERKYLVARYSSHEDQGPVDIFSELLSCNYTGRADT